jgi:hypothetical protein
LITGAWNLLKEIPVGFYWGFLGGISANCLRLFSFVGQSGPQRQAVLGDKLYKFEFIILPFIGGIVAAAYGEAGSYSTHVYVLPFHLGLSAPAIIRLGSGAMAHGNEPTN